MTPTDYYQEQCNKGLVLQDQHQFDAISCLQKIYGNLLQEHQKRHGIFSIFRKPRLVQGLYLWGGVGIGKTFLMDCFYHCIPFSNKIRMHFHQFMQMIQEELKKHQGKRNPLNIIAKELSRKYLLLCFDEFFVSDIVDAMLLGRLFQALFSHGVCLIATSNVMPDDLYKNGLQRQLFLPAISVLKQNTIVFYLPTKFDYRSRIVKNTGVFFTPNDTLATERMESNFSILSNGALVKNNPIKILGRSIQIVKQAGDAIWFNFDAICTVPRSQQDYLEIARKYNTIFISNIPTIPPEAKNQINLFIRMIDIFYDSRKRLVISSEVAIDEIYQRGDFYSDFIRTRSRLLEMQSDCR
ncbi:MAG: AFG1 family ATPase [Gammaproteobacteria bacterium]|nr:AFG1 family ATPase [Gammaproteobacteria bacterium]MCW5582400.1 AFG1 family ATPase [Gammaproteobacteria bacterium]